MSIRSLAYAFALGLCLTVFSGCATDNSTQTAGAEKEKISTTPWNKPASWEGQGSLGGMGLGGPGTRY